MKIGFLSIIGERGQWHVTKNFMRALQDGNELFLFGRPFNVKGGSYIQKIEDFPEVKADAVYSDEYDISPETFEKWIKEKKLDVVFFNEEYDWSLVDIANKYAKTVTYLDYFTEETILLFQKYDKVIACARHAYDVFKDNKNTVFVEWGVDEKLFVPTDNAGESTFFHSSGWGGNNWRKMGHDILKAFHEIRQDGFDFTMYFHSQISKEFYPEYAQVAMDACVLDGSLKVFFGSVKHPGLYHMGRINVAVSKLEGLGLFLPEGLSCGMPTITTDAAPMNQFVQNNKNGLLVRTIGSHMRKDPYYFPEYELDLSHLKECMISLGSDESMISRMSENARKSIVTKHSFAQFKKAIENVFATI